MITNDNTTVACYSLSIARPLLSLHLKKRTDLEQASVLWVSYLDKQLTPFDHNFRSSVWSQLIFRLVAAFNRAASNNKFEVNKTEEGNF